MWGRFFHAAVISNKHLRQCVLYVYRGFFVRAYIWTFIHSLSVQPHLEGLFMAKLRLSHIGIFIDLNDRTDLKSCEMPWNFLIKLSSCCDSETHCKCNQIDWSLNDRKHTNSIRRKTLSKVHNEFSILNLFLSHGINWMDIASIKRMTAFSKCNQFNWWYRQLSFSSKLSK